MYRIIANIAIRNDSGKYPPTALGCETGQYWSQTICRQNRRDKNTFLGEHLTVKKKNKKNKYKFTMSSVRNRFSRFFFFIYLRCCPSVLL